jgi:hypothetical protein
MLKKATIKIGDESDRCDESVAIGINENSPKKFSQWLISIPEYQLSPVTFFGLSPQLITSTTISRK